MQSSGIPDYKPKRGPLGRHNELNAVEGRPKRTLGKTEKKKKT